MNQHTIPAFIVIVLVGLNGCTVGPGYRESVPAVPDHWQAGQVQLGITSELHGTAALKPIDPETLKNWWKSFGDARLDRLMGKALAGNLDLKIALTRIDQASAERRGTRAKLFPQVDVGPDCRI